LTPASKIIVRGGGVATAAEHPEKTLVRADENDVYFAQSIYAAAFT